MSSSSDECEEYRYYIVEFIKRGRQGTRSIDVVPSKWTTYDKKKNKFKTAFMDPPYDEENLTLLQNMVQRNAAAPTNWSQYSIKIVAKASTYFGTIFICFK